ncbi:helix-turn-helix domain-containing protein [Pseudonocardia sp. C8]|uniref:AraC-like ligand-binding domain-containing protein n=1 Tax=Pseudonocardia sp. C8 TaxID=2762759 RepID=UPI001642C1C7|nr:helix-turn-helix domain-containing protein [Pseudonocardia sp. C8]MBC3191914.1 helix-turn-helix domain-containing protein [Pseudonocardia sp. C8]
MTGPSFSDVHDVDIDAADAHLPVFMHLDHSPAARFVFHRHTVERGPFRVEETWCTDSVHVEVLDESTYAVGLPLRGALHVDHRGDELDLAPGRAAVFDPRCETAMATSDRFDVVLVRIRSAALEDALEALLGRPVRRPLRLRTTISLDTDAGRALTEAIRRAVHARPDCTSSLSHPISAEPLQDRLLAGLLLATDHPDRDALDEPVPTWGPRAVGRCVDLVETHPERPLTLAGLAAFAGMSVRVLEGCWVRHRDHPPAHDIERVRLDRAHRDLESHRPGETTVDEVAASWGFVPESFVEAYGARFGRGPAETLRGPAFA